jgi:hypothetical protein
MSERYVMMCDQSPIHVAICFQQVADEAVGNTFRPGKCQQSLQAASEV